VRESIRPAGSAGEAGEHLDTAPATRPVTDDAGGAARNFGDFQDDIYTEGIGVVQQRFPLL
jgi:hypothetical protein